MNILIKSGITPRRLTATFACALLAVTSVARPGAQSAAVSAEPSAQEVPAETARKLDQALLEWQARPGDNKVQVLIQTRPGSSDAVRRRLASTAEWVRAMHAPNLLVAQLSRRALALAAADHDVTRISSDAPVSVSR